MAAILTIAPAANAGLVSGLVGAALPGCGAVSYPFAQFGDTGAYCTPANNGFENGAAGWTLYGGAAVVADNEPWYAGGPGRGALDLPPGAVAVSPSVPISLLDPYWRFFAAAGAADGPLRVQIVFRGLTGNVTGLLNMGDAAGVELRRLAADRRRRLAARPAPRYVCGADGRALRGVERRLADRRRLRRPVAEPPRLTSAGKTAHSRDASPASVVPMASKTATPWGPADLVEELTLRQQVGQRRFASVVQLLETERGERLVRFAYSTGGTARRGPVTLRERDIARLRADLARHPALAEALGW